MTEIRYVEIYYDEIANETDSAYLFKIDGEEVWIAKSQCVITDGDIVEMPEWLATDKELVF
jgi:hypothetical protein